jgi:hypothetical protein
MSYGTIIDQDNAKLLDLVQAVRISIEAHHEAALDYDRASDTQSSLEAAAQMDDTHAEYIKAIEALSRNVCSWVTAGGYRLSREGKT